MKRKVLATSIEDLTALDEAAIEYRRLAAKVASTRLKIEKKIADIQAEFAAELNADIDAMADVFADIQSWAILNKEERFSDAKSMQAAGATIGFRKSPPSIKQMRGVKADHSIERLRGLAGDKYVRTIEEINKEALLADQKELGATFFTKAGLVVDQDEKFFVDPGSAVLDAQSQPVNV